MKKPTYSGIITNYNCTAACRHCMFASSPECGKEYISREMADRTAVLLKEAGTDSVHIGGGEPFINFDSLCTLVSALGKHGIGIDYIETNAFWCSDDEFIRKRLEKLMVLGVSTIMVSVDPFHIEYVPLERPLKLCGILEECGFEYFVWQMRFLERLMKLDITKTHGKEELSELLGKDYIKDTASEYGLGMNGRALFIASYMYENKPYEALATSDACSSLSVPRHCHFDLYGNAVPSRCPGIAAEARDYLEGNIDSQKYPVFYRLLTGGTKELFEYAKLHGFVPKNDGYPTRCAFCYSMREHLEKANPSPDISPSCFYESMRKST